MKRYVYSMAATMFVGYCMPTSAHIILGAPPLPSGGSDNHFIGRYFAGGYTIAAGEAANLLDNGWNMGTGFQWRLPPGPVSLRLGVEYSHNKATNQLLGQGPEPNRTQINNGFSELFSTDLDAIYHIPLSRSINSYVMAGGGGAVRRISLTHTVGASPFCNSWAGFCDTGSQRGDVLLNSDKTGRWEWNAGVGLRFSLGGEDAFFVEARYVEVETPVPTRSFPIRVGLLIF